MATIPLNVDDLKRLDVIICACRSIAKDATGKDAIFCTLRLDHHECRFLASALPRLAAHGEGGAAAETFIRRLLNPEELGMAVPAHVRDEARRALGIPTVEGY